MTDSVTIILEDPNEGQFDDFMWQFTPAIPAVGDVFTVNNYSRSGYVMDAPEQARYRVLTQEIEYRVHTGGGHNCLVILTVERVPA